MTGLLIALGALVLGALAFFLWVLLAYVAYSAVAAASVCRWLLAVQHEHPKAVRKAWWRWMVQFFFRQWWDFICTGAECVTIEGRLGTWYGIGRWEVRGP